MHVFIYILAFSNGIKILLKRVTCGVHDHFLSTLTAKMNGVKVELGQEFEGLNGDF